MFLIKADFRKDLLILFIITVLLGTLLVVVGGYVTDNYFSRMVTGLIGDYGEYDFLFTLASDKKDLALEQIKSVIKSTLPGTKLSAGPEVAGSSNYLLKLPAKYKNEEVYQNMGSYFSDIPGLMSRTIMTEPRLSLRGFRGDSLNEIRPLIEKIPGINFIYYAGDGLDIIVDKAELVPEVKNKIEKILEKYKMLEIRYPLNQRPENSTKLKNEIMQLAKTELADNQVLDVTNNYESDQITLFKNLRQMKTFLTSYATKVIINNVEDSVHVYKGSELIIPVKTEQEADKSVVLEVIDNSDNTIKALIQRGDIKDVSTSNPQVYLRTQSGDKGRLLGTGQINNPRQDLADSLDKLNEITPALNDFMKQSEQLVKYSDQISDELTRINQGLTKLESGSQQLTKSLNEWQEKDLSVFLTDLLQILDEIKNNTGNLNQIQTELVKTSNNLREASGMIEQKIVYIPRNNSIYQELNQLKSLFLQLSTTIDDNYDIVAERMENINPVLNSIDEWKGKINSLMKIEDTLNSGAKWDEIKGIMGNVDKTLKVVDTSGLQKKLTSIQDMLLNIKTDKLPAVIDQLTYIQDSLPDLKESEIIETINLIDKYIAGQVIPGDQIQILIKGSYDSEAFVKKIKPLINNPAVSYLNMDAGAIQPNPRGEVFNILSQVRAVISTIIALIFTIFVMILDQTLIISIIRLNGHKGYFYSFFSGSLVFSLIYYCSQINFPYLNIYTNILIGGSLGLLIGLFAGMLNPVSREEWEAGKAMGFSFAEIMHEIIIPSGKPGLLYLINYPKVIFK